MSDLRKSHSLVEFDWFACLYMMNNRATEARTGSYNNNAFTQTVHKATGACRFISYASL